VVLLEILVEVVLNEALEVLVEAEILVLVLVEVIVASMILIEVALVLISVPAPEESAAPLVLSSAVLSTSLVLSTEFPAGEEDAISGSVAEMVSWTPVEISSDGLLRNF